MSFSQLPQTSEFDKVNPNPCPTSYFLDRSPPLSRSRPEMRGGGGKRKGSTSQAPTPDSKRPCRQPAQPPPTPAAPGGGLHTLARYQRSARGSGARVPSGQRNVPRVASLASVVRNSSQLFSVEEGEETALAPAVDGEAPDSTAPDQDKTMLPLMHYADDVIGAASPSQAQRIVDEAAVGAGGADAVDGGHPAHLVSSPVSFWDGVGGRGVKQPALGGHANKEADQLRGELADTADDPPMLAGARYSPRGLHHAMPLSPSSLEGPQFVLGMDPVGGGAVQEVSMPADGDSTPTRHQGAGMPPLMGMMPTPGQPTCAMCGSLRTVEELAGRVPELRVEEGQGLDAEAELNGLEEIGAMDEVADNEGDGVVTLTVRSPAKVCDGWTRLSSYQVFSVVTERVRGPTASVQRRYNDFAALRAMLQTAHGECEVPMLPEKDRWGKFQVQMSTGPDSLAGPFVEARRQGLQAFLDAINQEAVLRRDPAIVRFLGVEARVLEGGAVAEREARAG